MIILHFQSFLEIYGLLLSKKPRWRITLNFKNRLNFNLFKRPFPDGSFPFTDFIKPNPFTKSFPLKNLTYLMALVIPQ